MALNLRDDDAAELRTLSHLALSDHERARSQYLLGGSGSSAGPFGGLSARDLDALYAQIGYLAALDAPGGRDADFARNQSQGAWAEGLLSAYTGAQRFAPFGLSDPISPTASGYEAVRRKHRDVLLREGKRPDFLLVPTAGVDANPAVLEWQTGQLTATETAALPTVVTCAVEVKSSLFDFGARESYRVREPGLPSISITVKDEELSTLNAWEATTGVPIIIVQVFVDSMHACSLAVFRKAMAEGKTKPYTEPKTTKLTHRLRLPPKGWRIADIAVPTGYRFATSAKGDVTAPSPWPTASISNVNLGGIVDAAPRLKAALLKGR